MNIYKKAPEKGKILDEVEDNARERAAVRVPLLVKGAAAYAAERVKTGQGRAEINVFLAERNAPYIAEHWDEPEITGGKFKDAPPPEYAKMAEAEARRLNLPIRLCIAMMVVESNSNPRATSPAKARGLMQVTPVTVKELAACDPARFGKLLDAKGEPVMKALEDPKTGIEAGLAALKMYMDRYDGNPESALFAYNWGPANVGKKREELTEEAAKGYDRSRAYVSDIQTVLGTTDGSPKRSKAAQDHSGKTSTQAKGPKKAPLPATSLLHYLTPEEVKKYQPARVPPLTM